MFGAAQRIQPRPANSYSNPIDDLTNNNLYPYMFHVQEKLYNIDLTGV